ncbi:MAG: response regulator [Micromonosporaceae bacterium]|nr:response regulator [Micromonosporaceae bacterium]
MRIRLVAVDRHTLARLGLAYATAATDDIELVGGAEDAQDARRLVADLAPTVVTIGGELTDSDGITLGRELRRAHPGLGVVLLAAADDGLLLQALQAGLSAFVTKTADTNEILAAIRHAAVSATTFASPGLAAAIAARHHRPSSPLSAREHEVLHLLRDGYTTPRIAVALSVSESTVKTYIGRLYEKLGAGNRAQALMTAVRRGLLTEPARAEAAAPARTA